MRRRTQTKSLLLVSLAVASLAGCAGRPPKSDASGCNLSSATCERPLTTGSISPRPGLGDTELTQPPPSLLVGRTVGDTPDVQAALARTASAAADIESAQAMTRPQLSLESSGGYGAIDSSSLTGGRDGESYSYAVTANLPLHQGGRDRAALAIAQSEFRASVESARDVVIATALSLLSAKTEINRQADSIAILDRHIQNLRRLRRAVEGEKRAGTATAVDVGEVDRQLLRLQVERQQSALGLTAAQETILRLNAYSVPKTVLTPEELAARLPERLPDLLNLAMRNNPRISARLAQMDAASAQIDQARAAYNPSVNLVLSTGGQQTAGSRDNAFQSSALVRLSVPLYSGGAREAGITKRHENFRAVAFDKDAAVLGVRAAVTSAFDRKTQAQDMLAVARRQLSVARTQIDSVRKERQLGERSVFDEIRSISDTADAELDVASAIYQQSLAEFILAAETGMLAEMLGLSITTTAPSGKSASLTLRAS